MSKKRLDRFGKPALFRTVERSSAATGFSTELNRDYYNSRVPPESSFKFDPYGSPMKSTQQLSVDFSKFENHTFFNSAVAKSTVAFNKIINKYPFDGTLFEIDEFEGKLTGYENYILENFDKYTGYLTPTGSCYIQVKNIAGYNFPAYSTDKTGKNAMNPIDKSISIEAFVAIPDDEHLDDMGLFYMSGSSGYKIEAKINSSGLADTHCNASFRILSGSSIFTIDTDFFRKGVFNHLSFVVDRTENKLRTFLNAKEKSTSTSISIGSLSLNEDLYLMKGGVFDNGTTVSNYFNMSGSIKDVRMYHQVRDEEKISSDYKKSVYKNEHLVLNFRFNEPTGSYSAKSFALDTSGNSLHSRIITEDNSQTFYDEIRGFMPYDNPVTYENKKRSHILFPDYPTVISYHQSTITAGSEYDLVNPNLITRMIPPHYYEESIFETGTQDETSVYKEDISGESIPGSVENIKTNILNVILFSWANVFDEIKMFIDAFGNLIFSDYNDDDIVPDQMILMAAKHLGVDLPPMFTTRTSEDFIEEPGELEASNETRYSLKKIQSLIWKRILADSSYYKKTKGTIESLKSVFRSSGINPDRMFAFIEKGSNVVHLSNDNTEFKILDSAMFNFSGSESGVSAGTLDKDGNSSSYPVFKSREMSQNQEYIMSGSWSYEGFYRFPNSIESGEKQSLVRLSRMKYNDHTDHTLNNIGGVLNIVAEKETTTSLTGTLDSVTAIFTDDSLCSDPHQILIDNSSIFDGDVWYVSFSKEYQEDEKSENFLTGSIYTLRCYKCGEESQRFSKSLTVTGSNLSIQNEDTLLTSLGGPIVTIGSQSLGFQDKKGIYNVSSTSDQWNNINQTNFSGKVNSIRFWSQFLCEVESENHSNDLRNYGTENPNENSIFKNVYGKLRLNVSVEHNITSSIAGDVILKDLTQNEATLSESERTRLSGFENSKSVSSFEKIPVMSSANKIDELNSSNKVRIRSLESDPNFSLGYQSTTPVYSTIDSGEISEDARFSIEMSVARIINEKINNEVSDVKFFEDILGKQNYDFSNTYYELENFSNLFFDNFEGNINIDKLLNVYTWLESSFEAILRKSLPKKTKFLGMNYVVEPHTLERSKLRLYNENTYMVGEENNENTEVASAIQVYSGDISIF